MAFLDSSLDPIAKGKTWTYVYRWMAPPLVWKAITAIPNTAPATLTVTGHGAPDEWPCWVLGVGGMTEINNTEPDVGDDPDPAELRPITVVNANSVQFNNINPLRFGTYTSGGYLVYLTPQDLAGDVVVRMTFRNKVGGDALFELDSDGNGITLDNTAKTITIELTATQTEAITWRSAVWEIEAVDSQGKVHRLDSGTIEVEDELVT